METKFTPRKLNAHQMARDNSSVSSGSFSSASGAPLHSYIPRTAIWKIDYAYIIPTIDNAPTGQFFFQVCKWCLKIFEKLILIIPRVLLSFHFKRFNWTSDYLLKTTQKFLDGHLNSYCRLTQIVRKINSFLDYSTPSKWIISNEVRKCRSIQVSSKLILSSETVYES